MGNPEFCLPALKVLHESEAINLQLVCGGLDKKSGRGQKLTSPSTISFAKENNINYLQCENINKSEKFFKATDELQPDLIIVFAFSHFLGKRILDLPKIGCFNIHTSLLPRYRGSSPIHYALLNGDEETGISIQKMVKKMDAGDLVISNIIKIDQGDDFFSLCEKFQKSIPGLVRDFIQLAFTKNLNYSQQNENDVSFAPLIQKDDGLIKPKRDSLETVINKIRALKMWPGTFCYINNQRYKIHDAIASDEKVTPGIIKLSKSKMLIGLVDGSLEIKSIQPPGKKAMSAFDFINGIDKKANLIITEQSTESKI